MPTHDDNKGEPDWDESAKWGDDYGVDLTKQQVLEAIKAYCECALNGDAGNLIESVPETKFHIMADVKTWVDVYYGEPGV
jgi:hypothetical protein